MTGNLKTHLWLLALVLVAALGFTRPVIAQDDQIPLAYRLSEYSQVGMGYIWEDGHHDSHFAGTLPTAFGFMSAISESSEDVTVRFGVDWVIGSYALSPNKEQLAFSAFDPSIQFNDDGTYTSRYQYGLFFYNFLDDKLHQVAIDHPVEVIWSPDGKTLLLPATGIPGEPQPFYSQEPDTLLFDLATQTFSTLQVGDPPLFYVDGFDEDYDVEGQTFYASARAPFVWLPDGRLIFWSGGTACPDDCTAWSDFYIANRDGSAVNRLTHLEEQLPASISRYTSGAFWSPVDERLYMHLETRSTQYQNALYSTDLEGNLREELLPQPQTQLLTVHPVAAQQAVYDVATGENNWQLLQLNGSNETVRTIAAFPLEGSVEAGSRIYRANLSAISPDGQYIAVNTIRIPTGAFNGVLGATEVIDLSTGERIQSIKTGVACDLRWLDTTRFIYQSVPDAQPNAYCPKQQTNLYRANIETGTTLELYDNRGDDVILLP